MPQDLSTGFIGRLRARDPQAWFELWEIFGPVLRGQLHRWGKGQIGAETVQDLSQETLAALSQAIDTHDAARGVRFSTWLLAIARYTLSDEFDRRMALKRGAGRRPLALEEAYSKGDENPRPDEQYHALIFGAKVEAAIRMVEREAEFMDFNVFRMRTLEGRTGVEVAESMGLSEASVSRRLAKVRKSLRGKLGEVVERFSFTQDEIEEPGRKGLDPNPNKASDALFDEAVAEVYHRYLEFREDASAGPS
ncbi:RNA polymerase sigma factor [Engelhardtia mirabilis]|uniref:RNA polymerase sigma factor n=1 Tax=Engelhardtia mirabilis TaxID=2528011 RepID=A0A518BFQ3_9BACT|nr:RNA polymerase sigma factor [Planctomycetes bacterium Pla133]QDV00137.1 RNA polymerase sigma factor [Planctomycetes bacterium Pla86]